MKVNHDSLELTLDDRTKKKRTMDYTNPMIVVIVTDKNDGRVTRSGDATLTNGMAVSRTVPGGFGGHANGNCPPRKNRGATEVRDPARKKTRARGAKETHTLIQRGSDFANVARKKRVRIKKVKKIGRRRRPPEEADSNSGDAKAT